MLRVAPFCLLCLGAFGCVDTTAPFDEFTKRQRAKNERDQMMGDQNTGGQPGDLDGGCLAPTAQQFAGTYLFAMSASPSPDRPILALLTVAPRMKDDKVIGELTFEPLSIEDRMFTVGVKNDGTFELAGTSLMTPPFGVVLPGNANPVQPGLNAEADFELVSDICLDGGVTVDFFCGEAKGNITVPLTLPLEGSTFGAVRIEEGRPFPAAITSCAGAITP